MKISATLAFAAIALMASMPQAKANEDGATVSFEIMKLEVAQRAAMAALEACRKAGFQITVSVVDRFGNPQVLLRDRFAGAHTPDTARRKAWTSVSFRTDTLALAELTKAGSNFSGIRHVSQAMAVGGGVPIEAAGSIVGGIGVSGAPSGAEDDACSRAGIDAVADDLAF